MAVPVDSGHPCTVIMVPRRVERLGLAIRGGPLHPSWSDTLNLDWFTWCGERREPQALGENPRALALAARLGVVDLVDRIGLRGNVIVTGPVDGGLVRDVPRVVLEAAYRTRLLDHVTGASTAAAPPGAGMEPVRALTGDATVDAEALPYRPLSQVRAPVDALVWEDPEIMARVLAGLEAERAPGPDPAPDWDAGSWWEEPAM